ncbi:MAG: hypothetical protein U0V02_06035 [Anaerolineales bacterium]
MSLLPTQMLNLLEKTAAQKAASVSRFAQHRHLLRPGCSRLSSVACPEVHEVRDG